VSFSWRCRLLNAPPAPTGIHGTLESCALRLGGGSMRLTRSTLMSHQLAAKKGSFEIPPLNWKAPDANKQADRRDAASADTDSSKKAEASRSKS